MEGKTELIQVNVNDEMEIYKGCIVSCNKIDTVNCDP